MVYFTSLGVVRPTWARCVKVRQILRNLLIKVDERDLFMSRENQMELMDRMSSFHVTLPQVYVNGEFLGVRKIQCDQNFRHKIANFLGYIIIIIKTAINLVSNDHNLQGEI